jgi:Ni,Fe-hydrogenase III small subunit/ferredoxin
MAWALRGLRRGVVTTDYPARPDVYFEAWRGVARVRPDHPGLDHEVLDGAQSTAIQQACPTGAIGVDGHRLTLDQGRCIGCGRCVEEFGSYFSWRPGSDLAQVARTSLVVPATTEDAAALATLRASLLQRTRTFGRSVHLRHVDAGSDGAEEWELAALLNPVYDVHRLGFFFTASPRHADILLVTGIGAAGMRQPLQRTLEGMPRPLAVIAVGTDACSGGLFRDTSTGSPGLGHLVDVDVWIPGSPPSPFAILHGLLLAMGREPADQNRTDR